MAILNWSNALAAAGKSIGELGESGVRSALADELAAKADARVAKREEAGDIRRADLAEKGAIGAEQRGIMNRAVERNTITGELIANAPALRQIKIDDALEVKRAQDAYDQDPTNMENKARAEAAKAKSTALAAADLTKELIARPDYLKNIKAVLDVEHPERAAAAAASASSAALSSYKLTQEKLIGTARVELRDAKTPEEKATAKAKIEALEWSVAGDRAQQTADAAMFNSIERNIKDMRTEAANPTMGDDASRARATDSANRAQATLDAMREEYSKKRGLPAAPAKAQYDSNTGEIKQGDKVLGTVAKGLTPEQAVAAFKNAKPAAPAPFTGGAVGGWGEQSPGILNDRVKPGPRGGFVVNLPGRAMPQSLKDKIFESREEALAALDAL